MQAAHHSAAKSRLQQATHLNGKVHDAVRTDAEGQPVRANYVVLKTSLPGYTEGRLGAPQAPDGDQLVEWSVRVVAVDLDGLYLLMDAVIAQMGGHKLTVAGRNLTEIERTELEEPDYDWSAAVHFQDAVFEATTSRV